ncbi:MAG: hypothetical protein EXR69_07210 [Myxococcales bacterium]|nr:hypothetical protein [Myxococcales bacterium]
MLYFLFFCSGATSLVYETVWGRELHLVFGTSQFAIATVLAAFMTGLSAGGWLASRAADRLRRPLVAYAVLEVLIGLFALAFPWLRDGLTPIYLSFFREAQPSPLVFGAFQFVLLGVTLLLPTACMGATLPILARFVETLPPPKPADTYLDVVTPTQEAGPGAIIGRLYGVNTAGAVFGVWLVGFVLLPDLGVHVTTWIAATANFALAGGALLLATRLDGAGATAVSDIATPGAENMATTTATTTATDTRWLVVGALAGLSSLGLEVAWFRLMALTLGASTYAFSVMLLAFLVGIAGGGYLGGAIADRIAPRGAGADALPKLAMAVATTQLAVAALAWGAMWLWPWLPISFVWLYFQIRETPELIWTMKCVLSMAVMTPAALGMGVTFPLLTRAAGLAAGNPDGGGAGLARAVGRVYAANTLGSLTGAFLGGFVWLPRLWVAGTTTLCVCITLIAATVAYAAGRSPRIRLAAVGALALLIAAVCTFRAPWEPLLMTSGVYKYVDNLKEPTMAHLRTLLIDRYRLLYYNEGLSTVVTVAEDRNSGNVWLANNGKIDASTSADMPTQVLVAHLPMMFLPAPTAAATREQQPRTAMLIGLASGITLGALTLHPDLDRIDVVELEPSMPAATRLFDRFNHEALSDKRVHVIANDGRNQVLLSEPGSYDLIVAEPSNPWLTGVSNLFTREFFDMGKTRLKPRGVWSQWVQMYGMDSRDLMSVMRTFCQSFPHVLFFSSIRDADMVMVGSNDPIVMTEDLATALVHKTVGLEGEFANIGVLDGYDVLADYLFDRDQGLFMTNGIPLNTDDNLLVEYSAPKNLHRTTSGENMLMLLPVAQVPVRSVHTVAGLIRLADAYHSREDVVRALIALKEAERREPGRHDVQAMFAMYQSELREWLK